MLQAAAVLAVGATAVAFIAGLSTYLYIRFTQRRAKPPGEETLPLVPRLEVMSLETVLSIALGVGLAAACGFRVFVPLLVAAIAARSGHLSLSPGFAWLEGDGALLALGVATIFEVLAYSVPWLDHLLDLVATPAAVVAGVVASAAVFVELPPGVRWGAAVILGGGAAGAVQAGTVLARLKSTLFTGGFGNIAVALLELAGAVMLSLLAILAPAFVLLALAMMALLLVRIVRARRLAARPARPR